MAATALDYLVVLSASTIFNIEIKTLKVNTRIFFLPEDFFEGKGKGILKKSF